MHHLQESLEQSLSGLYEVFLEKLIAKKLREQGLKPTKRLSGKLAKHILSGNKGQFKYRSSKLSGNVNLTFTKADADELEKMVDDFGQNLLHSLVPALAAKTAKSVLQDLKSRWPEEYQQQKSDLSGFQERLEDRWGKTLGQLRMLLTMVREWCETAHNVESSRKKHKNKQLREVLIRLLVRACQVTDEIVCLLENGFADGAMARWRTLHEIAVVAAVIAQGGEPTAERYIAHQAIESKRALEKYLTCHKDLGYRPIPIRKQDKIRKAYDEAVTKYGQPFKKDYGWAALHLSSPRPTFADLEKAAGRAEMRSHYQIG